MHNKSLLRFLAVAIFASVSVASLIVVLVSSLEWELRSLLVLSLFLLLVVAVFVQEHRYGRKARYSEAAPYLRRIYKRCVDAAGDQDRSAEELVDLLRETCNDLQSSFSLITGTFCSSSIAVTEERSSQAGSTLETAVRFLCRDTHSAGVRPAAPEVPLWVDANTAFKFPKDTGLPFFSNNLPGRSVFQNQMVLADSEDQGEGSRLRSLFLSEKRRWIYPYKSKIAAPIQKENARPGQLIGYLIVDSPSAGAWYRRYDEGPIRAIAECLYPVVERWAELSISEGRPAPQAPQAGPDSQQKKTYD